MLRNILSNQKELLVDFNLLEMEKNKIHIELGTRFTALKRSEFNAVSL